MPALRPSRWRHEYRALDMANAAELQALFDEIKPDIIVPEVEAIATDVLAGVAAAGAQVVPSAEIAAICMDRERLRVLAHEELGLADYTVSFCRLAGRAARRSFGSRLSVRGQAGDELVWSRPVGGAFADAIDAAWTEAQEGRRAADEGDVSRVIVEALAPLERELTVLTVSSSAGIVTCAPIGQRQESGDYRESWQPATEPDGEAERARDIARTAVEGLVAKAQAAGETGWGVFGVELFVAHRRLDSVQRGLPPSARYRYGDDGLPASERVRAARPRDSRPADHPRACVAHDSGRLGGGKPCDCGGRRR